MPYNKARIFELNKEYIRHFTYVTIHCSPSRFTRETPSALYVACPVFTVGGTRGVTVNAVNTSIITSCIKSSNF